MANRKRNLAITFMVTENEKRMILERKKKTGMKDMSAYLRKSAIDVTIINVNTDGLKELARQVGAIGNNINQITRQYNQDRSIDQDSVELLLDYMKKLTDMVNKNYEDISYIKKHTSVESV